MTVAPAIRPDRVSAALRGWRTVRGLIWVWRDAENSSVNKMRKDRLRASWPSLAAAIDACLEIEDEGVFHEPLPCPMCKVPIAEVHGEVDPKAIRQVFRLRPCGHEVTREQALMAYEHGAVATATAVDGGSIVVAERKRVREEKGYTLTRDLARDPGSLAWAAWCYLDRAVADPDDDIDPDTPPDAWPWSQESWNGRGGRLRLLIRAASLIVAEIDATLARNSVLDPEA